MNQYLIFLQIRNECRNIFRNNHKRIQTKTLKLEEYKKYLITGYKPIFNTYGKTYILIDIKSNEYLNNSEINRFIKIKHPFSFKLSTYNLIQYINKEGQTIKYLGVNYKELSETYLKSIFKQLGLKEYKQDLTKKYTTLSIIFLFN